MTEELVVGKHLARRVVRRVDDDRPGPRVEGGRRGRPRRTSQSGSWSVTWRGVAPRQNGIRSVVLVEGLEDDHLISGVDGRKQGRDHRLGRSAAHCHLAVRVDGHVVSPGELSSDRRAQVGRAPGHGILIDVVLNRGARGILDRLTAKVSARGRIAESVEASLRISEGLARIVVGSDDDEWLLSERNACIECDVAFAEIAPRIFSFNSPHGACTLCNGLGSTAEFDPVRMVPDVSRSLAAGAIAAWGRRRRPRYYDKLLQALAQHFEVDLDTAWQDLPEAARAGVLYGTGTEGIAFEVEASGKTSMVQRRWDGVVGELTRRFEAGSEAEREEFARFRSPRACRDCGGARLHAFARSVRIGELSIADVTQLSVGHALQRIDELEFTPSQRPIAERIVREIRERLLFLANVGLGYLTLDRSSATLSGGEGQRIRLATQMGSRLIGVLYILDEPSIGLHPRDHERLLHGIRRLRDLGNTVIVVEHDEATIRAADFVIDMGPGAGIHGGEIVAKGSVAELLADVELADGRLSVGPPTNRRSLEAAGSPGPAHSCSAVAHTTI